MEQLRRELHMLINDRVRPQETEVQAEETAGSSLTIDSPNVLTNCKTIDLGGRLWPTTKMRQRSLATKIV